MSESVSVTFEMKYEVFYFMGTFTQPSHCSPLTACPKLCHESFPLDLVCATVGSGCWMPVLKVFAAPPACGRGRQAVSACVGGGRRAEGQGGGGEGGPLQRTCHSGGEDPAGSLNCDICHVHNL